MRNNNPYEVFDSSTDDHEQHSNRGRSNEFRTPYLVNDMKNSTVKYYNTKVYSTHHPHSKFRFQHSPVAIRHPWPYAHRMRLPMDPPYLFSPSRYNKQIAFYSPSMGSPIGQLNNLLANPTKENVMALFHSDGYLRLNMLYISPIAIKHFRERLQDLGLVNWAFGDNELIFKLKTHTISFRGSLKVTYRDTKIYCVELDFDPVIPDNSVVKFLKEVEIFLKNCDAVFFMTYTISIDTEILNHPLSESLSFLASRK